jgi:hypothetical protein
MNIIKKMVYNEVKDQTPTSSILSKLSPLNQTE